MESIEKYPPTRGKANFETPFPSFYGILWAESKASAYAEFQNKPKEGSFRIRWWDLPISALDTAYR